MRLFLGLVMTAAIISGGFFAARWWRWRREGELGNGRGLLLITAVAVLTLIGWLGIR